MRLKHDDVEFDMLDEDDLLWAEADAVERVVGKTMVQIGAIAQVCGCTHRLAEHKPQDPEQPDADLVCVQCGCDQPSSNTPASVAQAMLWVSMKRAQPNLTFKDVGQMVASSFQPVEEPPDPTEADASTDAERAMSASSPASSGSVPGNGTS